MRERIKQEEHAETAASVIPKEVDKIVFDAGFSELKVLLNHSQEFLSLLKALLKDLEHLSLSAKLYLRVEMRWAFHDKLRHQKVPVLRILKVNM